VQLGIPGLLIEALWLRDVGPAPTLDFVVPYRHLIPELDRERAYTEAEFLGVVQPLATERLKFNDSLPPNKRPPRGNAPGSIPYADNS